MLQDLRFTLRLILKERWFSAAAIVALALGIGVNAVGFSIVNAAFLRGLPFENADRLFMLTWQSQPSRSLISHPELRDLNASTRTFVGWGGSRNGTMNISDSHALPEQARGSWVTANVFGLIGQAPLLGRDFTPVDEKKGADPVAIISYTFWQRRYDGDPNILGTLIRINSQPATIVGVMARGMLFPDNTEVWAPEIPDEAKEKRDARMLDVFGLLKSESSLEEGRAETNGLLAQFATAYPDQYKNIKTARVETFTERYIGGAAKVMFWTMMGAVGFILLIACANVANLLLSRSAARAREVAVRSALGATRWRIVRQLLVESLALAFIGGAFGLVLTYTGVHLFDSAINDPGKPWWLDFRVDSRVLAYVALICAVTAVFFGLAPALHVSRGGAGQALKEGGRGTVGNRRARWFTGSMVVTELALAVVLLAGAGLMIRSFFNLERLNLGFSSEHLITMRLQLPDQRYDTPEARVAFYDRLLPKLAAVPGVESVAVSTTMPPFRAFGRGFEIEGRPTPRHEDEQLRASVVTITPAFFDVLGTAVRRGRSFGDGDGAPGSETVIVNERFASKFFPGEDPIGRRVRLLEREGKSGSTAPAWRTIVAVGPPIRHAETRQIENDPVIYTPLRQDAPAGASLVARSQLPPSALVDVLRRAVQDVDADQPLFTIQTLDQMMDEERWPFRLFGATFGIFGLIGLALASVGLYAVMAYAVTQRTSEIGVRMALGAQPKDVRWMVLRGGLVQLSIGLGLGLGGAYLLSTVMERVLVGISASDPVTFAGIAIILTIVALAACLIPARRATRIDPLVALRET
jgi:predicted permease